ncbi:MAG: M48 family metallopeptidase [Oligoflexia bacterium]|nr:M48 family metallopeptidase [Oligoflexia bacterium]
MAVARTLILTALLITLAARAEAAPLQSSEFGESQRILHSLGGDDLRAFFGFTPSITVFSSSMPNAYWLGAGRIYISQSLINTARSEAELAFVIAHELAHGLLNHPSAAFAQSSASETALAEREAEADELALKLLKNAGFDPVEGAGLLERVRAKYFSRAGLTNWDLSVSRRVLRLRAFIAELR